MLTLPFIRVKSGFLKSTFKPVIVQRQLSVHMQNSYNMYAHVVMYGCGYGL